MGPRWYRSEDRIRPLRRLSVSCRAQGSSEWWLLAGVAILAGLVHVAVIAQWWGS